MKIKNYLPLLIIISSLAGSFAAARLAEGIVDPGFPGGNNGWFDNLNVVNQLSVNGNVSIGWRTVTPATAGSLYKLDIGPRIVTGDPGKQNPNIRIGGGHLVTNHANGALVLNAGPNNGEGLAGIWFRKNRVLGNHQYFVNLGRITDAGDLGIGTVNPQAKLHVAGSAKIDQNLCVFGRCFKAVCPTTVGSAVMFMLSESGVCDNGGGGGGSGAPKLNVVYPNGGEKWTMGQNQTITWQYQALTGNVGIYLAYPDGGLCGIGSAPVSSGSFTFALKENQPCTKIPRTITVGNYRVALYADNGNPNVDWVAKDASDGDIIITTNNSTAPLLKVEVSPNTPSNQQIVMGSANVPLVTFRFTNTSTVEPITITSLGMWDDISATVQKSTCCLASFRNYSLWTDNNILIAGPAPYLQKFLFASPLTVASNSSIDIVLKANAYSFTSGETTDNSIHRFVLQTPSDVNAAGASSNQKAVITGITYDPTGRQLAPLGNLMTVLRTKLTVAGSAIGATSSRVRSSADDVAVIGFSADPAGDVRINAIKLRLQGLALAGGTAVRGRLLSGGADWNAVAPATCVANASYICELTFNSFDMPDYGPIGKPIIPAGTTKNITLRLDSSNFFNATNSSDSLSITISAAADVDWGDTAVVNIPNTTVTGLGLELRMIPVIIAAIGYE